MEKTNRLKIAFAVFVLFCSYSYGQKIPQEIQYVLDSVKSIANYRLQNCRVYAVFRWNSMYWGQYNNEANALSSRHRSLNHFPDRLRPRFLNTPFIEKADSSNLNIGMVYDESMRNRIVQLLRNEFREDELDTVVARRFVLYQKRIRRQALDLGMFDTLPIFRDSLQATKERRFSPPPVPRFVRNDIIDFLQFDTTAVFQKIFDSLSREWEKQTRAEAKTTIQFDLRALIELCGRINDERFIPELKRLYAESSDERIKETAEVVLVRMNVEPFRENFFRERIRRIEYIKNNPPEVKSTFNRTLGNPISDIAWNFRDQSVFKELSRFLLFDGPYEHLQINGDIHTISIQQKVYQNIWIHVRNSDLREMMVRRMFGNPELYKKVHEWMQKNYGRYEFRTWY